MSEVVQSTDTERAPLKRSAFQRLAGNKTLWRGVAAIIAFIILWEVGSQFKSWFGIEIWWVGKVAPPSDVFATWISVVQRPGYWESWYLSFFRVFLGFIIAQIIGIPFGLALAVNKYFRDIFFPPRADSCPPRGVLGWRGVS